ncbi:MAG: corrinoid protein [Ignavibacteriales bacterium]|nr:corrinoid protein [Ignavibacteriales bacterium]
MNDKLFQLIAQSVIDGEIGEAKTLARMAVDKGIPPLEIINKGYVAGMNYVGEQFTAGTMFLPHLVMAGEAMKAAMAILEPEALKLGNKREVLGTVVLGTVQGDIHEIGKSLVSIMLSANGFDVIDLGVNVSPQKFIDTVIKHNANIVGMSSLLTTTMTMQKTTIEALEEAGLRGKVKILVGGAPVTKRWAVEIGADGYGQDAMSAVNVAKSLILNPRISV